MNALNVMVMGLSIRRMMVGIMSYVLTAAVVGSGGQRMGPLTMEARAYGLERVLDIQERADVDLIDDDEECRIREMWSLDMWPRKWSAEDIDADQPIDAIMVGEDGQIVTQALLV